MENGRNLHQRADGPLRTVSAARYEQEVAYTSVRGDIADLVPADALNILDVGCSNGALGKFLKTQVPQRRITGIEIDSEYAHLAERVLDAVLNVNMENVELAAALQPHGPFDCIICADVLEHLRDPWRQLDDLVAMLNPEGSIIIALPNVRHHSAFVSIWLNGHFPRRSRGLFDATHLRWFTWADGVAMIRAAHLVPDGAQFSIRIGDRGGGVVNRAANRLLRPFAQWWLVREFLVYQFAIRARRKAGLPIG